MSDETTNGAGKAADGADYVTMTVHGQLFGIPVLGVQDILAQQQIAPIPLAPPEVAGALNLRGRIVTAVCVRRRMGLEPRTEAEAWMSVVVESGGELYSLLVDSVGEVLSLPADSFEKNPGTLDPLWREISEGVHRLDGQLLVVLDVERLLGVRHAEAA